jgi:hypothetical protein
MIQALLIKTVFEAAKRAFWKNGNPAAGIVKDVLVVKHETADPNINDELARVLAWVFRAGAIIAIVKGAQLAGFDVTPYLHLIFQSAAEEAAKTVQG